MASVSIGDLRTKAGELVERAGRGERITITCGETPVAELVTLARPVTTLALLLERRRRLPRVDPVALRSDIDSCVQP